MSSEDTIAAISTPLGEGGIGIVRLSGDKALHIAGSIFRSPRNKTLNALNTHQVIYGHIINPINGDEIDEVLVTVMKSPNSYTKEDIVEINCHGGATTLRKTLELVIKQGARLAEPGEFTKRAFLNGRIDLSQAEAVLDLIRSRTEQSSRIALEQLKGGLSTKIGLLRDRLTEICAHVEAHIDFPEDEIETATRQELMASIVDIRRELGMLSKTYEEARFFRDGLSTAIVGRPNVGKSSLLNTLLGKDRAIVAETPGTTRDLIEEYLNIKGLPLRIIDTAGIRDVEDIAEKEGVKRSLSSIRDADLVIAIFDSSEPLRYEDFDVIKKLGFKKTIFALNKVDLQSVIDESSFSSLIIHPSTMIIRISATRGDGLEELKEAVFNSCIGDWKEEREGILVTNIRHRTAIDSSMQYLDRSLDSLMERQPPEILALDLRDSLNSLGEIIGHVTTEDIINKIFSDFCIGK
jgi:tRNA modification GTPase